MTVILKPTSIDLNSSKHAIPLFAGKYFPQSASTPLGIQASRPPFPPFFSFFFYRPPEKGRTWLTGLHPTGVRTHLKVFFGICKRVWRQRQQSGQCSPSAIGAISEMRAIPGQSPPTLPLPLLPVCAAAPSRPQEGAPFLRCGGSFDPWEYPPPSWVDFLTICVRGHCKRC